MSSVLRFVRTDIRDVKYHPVEPLSVIAQETGIPEHELVKVCACVHAHSRRCGCARVLSATWVTHGGVLLQLNANENPYGTPQAVLDSLRDVRCVCVSMHTCVRM